MWVIYIGWGRPNHVQPLKAERFFPRCRKRKSETCKRNKTPVLRIADTEGHPGGDEGSPHIAAGSRKGTSVLKSQGNRFCQQSEWDWKLISPPESQERKTTLQTHWFHCETLSKRALLCCAGFYLQKWELINGRCLKLLSSADFVMQQ